MTQEERVIVSAYTGVLMCNFPDMHKYVEEKLGRPVFTHEFCDPAVKAEIKEKNPRRFLAFVRTNKEIKLRNRDYARVRVGRHSNRKVKP